MSQKTETELLRERVRSLEDTLGVRFIPAEGKDDYAAHIVEDGRWGVMPKLKQLFRWAERLGDQTVIKSFKAEGDSF